MEDYQEPERQIKGDTSKNSGKRFKRILIASLILAGSILFWFSGFFLGKVSVKLDTSSVSEVSIFQKKNGSADQEGFLSIEEQATKNNFLNDLKVSFEGGEMNFVEHEDGLLNFNESYRFTHQDKDYSIYLFVKKNFYGRTTYQGYEGSQSGIRIYDKEMNIYNTTKLGSAIVDTWGLISYMPTYVTAREIGGKKFLVYDSYFQPAAAQSRNYFIYRKEADSLIQIDVTTQNVEDIDEILTADVPGVDTAYKVLRYPDDFQRFINEVEILLSKIN